MAFDWTQITNFLNGLSPYVQYIFMGLGTVVVIGAGIDKMIPDEKDGGFSKKVLNVPVLGSFLTFLTRFSPWNVR